MRPINVEKLIGHRIDISDSYYCPTEDEVLDDYLRVAMSLLLQNENLLKDRLMQFRQKVIMIKLSSIQKILDKIEEISSNKKSI